MTFTRTCEADCPNPIQRWWMGRGLCGPHWLAARQYVSYPSREVEDVRQV